MCFPSSIAFRNLPIGHIYAQRVQFEPWSVCLEGIGGEGRIRTYGLVTQTAASMCDHYRRFRSVAVDWAGTVQPWPGFSLQ